MNVRNPYLLASAGVPLVAAVAAGAETETGANVRRAAGLTALLATGLWAWTGSDKAKSTAIGAGAAWGVLRLGVL